MDKKEVAAILKEMALMLEISGENVFKVRAHENAARVLEGLTGNLQELADSGELTAIKGIGKAIAEKIRALLETGTFREFEDLKASLPDGLLEIARIPGMGPKKVKAVYEELGVTSIAELEAACEADRVAGLKGFGKKTQDNIVKGIEQLRKFADQHLLSRAMETAEAILKVLRESEGVIRFEVAGSLRRRKEVVKDVDIVVSAAEEHRPGIMERFTTMDGVERVVGKGDTKSSIVLANGINADLRIVADDQFPYTLHHFTGSKEHNVAIRQRAIKRDMKVSEWGLFRGDELVPCNDEAALFEALGLAYIPPELRENYGEIEAAETGELPELVTMEDVRGIIHAHSTWSDGVNSIAEMAEACRARGWEYLAISDHSKAAAYANGLTVDRIRAQHEEIDALNAELEGFQVLKSIECDILADGSLDYDDEVLALFDLVIVSIHSKFGMTEAEGTKRIITAMENPFTTIVGHLTGRLLLSREGYPVNQQAVIEAAADLGVSIEINANPRRLDLDWRQCKYAVDKGVMISVNPDAHKIAGLDDMQYGIGIARKGWVTAERFLNARGADEVLAFARKRRGK